MIGYQEVISNQGEEGPGPLRLTLTPGFLPTCLSCPRVEKRFLASALLLLRLPVVQQYRARSSCVGAPATLLSYRKLCVLTIFDLDSRVYIFKLVRPLQFKKGLLLMPRPVQYA